MVNEGSCTCQSLVKRVISWAELASAQSGGIGMAFAGFCRLWCYDLLQSTRRNMFHRCFSRGSTAGQITMIMCMSTRSLKTTAFIPSVPSRTPCMPSFDTLGWLTWGQCRQYIYIYIYSVTSSVLLLLVAWPGATFVASCSVRSALCSVRSVLFRPNSLGRFADRSQTPERPIEW